MDDRTLVLVMTKGIGTHLTNDQKRGHLADSSREHLINQVCIQEILPPESGMRRRWDEVIKNYAVFDLDQTKSYIFVSKLFGFKERAAAHAPGRRSWKKATNHLRM